MCLARYIVGKACVHATQKFTIAVSNVPGPLKPFVYENEKGQQSSGCFSLPYIMSAGQLGLCLSAMSFAQDFRFSITADEAVFKDTKALVDSIYKNIKDEIERMKDVPVPSKN